MRKILALLSMAVAASVVPVLAPSTAAAAGPLDVGVLLNAGNCAGNEFVRIRMDDEDDNNANFRSGYIGSIISDSNTEFGFCRVSGIGFFPDKTRPYAVLKLGATCPNNSIEFSRRFDNEDSGNNNFSVGNIVPNVSDSNTLLFFCLFPPDSVNGKPRPFLGFAYGFFGVGNWPHTGVVHTDDEDDDNNNRYAAPPSFSAMAQSIISAGPDTNLRTATHF